MQPIDSHQPDHDPDGPALPSEGIWCVDCDEPWPCSTVRAARLDPMRDEWR